MPPGWEQRFDYFLANSDGQPISVLIDMAARDHLPVAGLPLFMTLRIRMNKPKPNGLRSGEEFDALVSLEEEVRRLMDDSVKSIFWGHRIGDGRTDLYFYVERLPESTITAPLMPYLLTSGYAGEFRWTDDPEWREYQAAFPNLYLQQTMSNRRLQRELQRRGDRLDRRRRVDHTAYFPSAAAARDAAKRLRKVGFSVGRVHDRDTATHPPLEFHRRDAVSGSRPDEVTNEIFDCIEPFGGTYDGWGCMVHR